MKKTAFNCILSLSLFLTPVSFLGATSDYEPDFVDECADFVSAPRTLDFGLSSIGDYVHSKTCKPAKVIGSVFKILGSLADVHNRGTENFFTEDGFEFSNPILAAPFSKDSYKEASLSNYSELLRTAAYATECFGQDRRSEDARKCAAKSSILLRALSCAADWYARERCGTEDVISENQFKDADRRWGVSRLASIWLRAFADCASGNNAVKICSLLDAGAKTWEMSDVLPVILEEEPSGAAAREATAAVSEEEEVLYCFCGDPLEDGKAVKKMPCCGAQIHQCCLDKWIESSMGEERQASADDVGGLHPGGLNYDVYCPETRRWQDATPQTESEWKWHEIKGKKYFLYDGGLWRYDYTDIPDDDANYVAGWWHIKAPTCPFCRNIFEDSIEKYRIKP